MEANQPGFNPRIRARNLILHRLFVRIGESILIEQRTDGKQLLRRHESYDIFQEALSRLRRVDLHCRLDRR